MRCHFSHASTVLPSAFGVAAALARAALHAQDVVKIGFASPLTGGQANYGKDNQNGAQMAIDELNAQGVKIGGKAVKFELMAEDDQADPKMGPLVAQKFVDAKVNGVVAHFNSGVTIPASSVYSNAGIPQLSVSTNVKYTQQGYKTAFRLMADDGKQGKALGEYAVKTLKLKRLAVIDDRDRVRAGARRRVREGGARRRAGRWSSTSTPTTRRVDFAAVLHCRSRARIPRRSSSAATTSRPAPMAKQMKAARHEHQADGRRDDELRQVHRARRPRRRRRVADAGRRASTAGRQGVRRQVQGRGSARTSAAMRQYFYDGEVMMPRRSTRRTSYEWP